MREIKFRFGWYWPKDITNPDGPREWLFGYHTIKELIGGSGEGEIFTSYKSRDEWTGLQDKSGRDIYEGDIVTDEEVVGEVYFHNLIGYSNKPGELSYVVGDRTKPTIYNKLGLGYVGIWEVIGNTYENPELLREP